MGCITWDCNGMELTFLFMKIYERLQKVSTLELNCSDKIEQWSRGCIIVFSD